jgi:hypothetical protein
MQIYTSKFFFWKYVIFVCLFFKSNYHIFKKQDCVVVLLTIIRFLIVFLINIQSSRIENYLNKE